MQSRNNGEYDKPLYSISLVREGDGGGQVTHKFTASVDTVNGRQKSGIENDDRKIHLEQCLINN